jgi:hypothetical protein
MHIMTTLFVHTLQIVITTHYLLYIYSFESFLCILFPIACIVLAVEQIW